MKHPDRRAHPRPCSLHAIDEELKTVSANIMKMLEGLAE